MNEKRASATPDNPDAGASASGLRSVHPPHLEPLASFSNPAPTDNHPTTSAATAAPFVPREHGRGRILYAGAPVDNRAPAWTDDDKERVLRLANEGYTNHEIGKVMGRTAAAIATCLHQMRREGHVVNRTTRIGDEAPYKYEGRKGAELLAKQIQDYWHERGRTDVFCIAEADGHRWTIRSNLVAGKPVASVRP